MSWLGGLALQMCQDYDWAVFVSLGWVSCHGESCNRDLNGRLRSELYPVWRGGNSSWASASDPVCFVVFGRAS